MSDPTHFGSVCLMVEEHGVLRYRLFTANMTIPKGALTQDALDTLLDRAKASMGDDIAVFSWRIDPAILPKGS